MLQCTYSASLLKSCARHNILSNSESFTFNYIVIVLLAGVLPNYNGSIYYSLSFCASIVLLVCALLSGLCLLASFFAPNSRPCDFLSGLKFDLWGQISDGIANIWTLVFSCNALQSDRLYTARNSF